MKLQKYLFEMTTLICCFILMSSCKKFVEVDPPITTINGENAFNENGNAIAVLTGIYANMSSSPIDVTQGWMTNISFVSGLTGDELELHSTEETYQQYYQNNISPIDNSWYYFYRTIFIANSAIEQLPAGRLLSEDVRKQLLGEAKFIRAFCYFYLVNLYGDVPYQISTDFKINRMLSRTAKETIYFNIVSDLKEAQQLLNANYVAKDAVSLSDERIRPSKWVATALLSRVYLYMKNYSDAENQAGLLLDGNPLYSLVGLDQVFLKNSQEAIWQLQPTGTQANRDANTKDGQVFKLSVLEGTDSYKVSLKKALYDSFDDHDLRKSEWVGSVQDGQITYYFPYKYKYGLEDANTNEYAMVLRLGEQYLIRAEARIKQGKIAEGISDINKLRARATSTENSMQKLEQLPLNLTISDALLAVENERKHELFTEWGHRWLDLKRTSGFSDPGRSRADELFSSVKPGWQSTDQLFPLPQNDVDQNPNLRGHQNAGY